MKVKSGRPGQKPGALLVGILLGALVLRGGAFLAVYAQDPTRILTADSSSYVDSARALVEVGRFAVAPELPGVPQTVRTPGYPLFIAALYALSGPSHVPVVLAQVLVSVATIGLVYLIGRRFWGPAAATIAGLIVALDYATFLYSQLLLTETLFTFVLVLTTWAGVRLLLADRRRGRYALCVGLGLALGALIRPIAYYLVFVVLFAFLVAGVAARWKRNELVLVLLLVSLPWVLLVGGWRVRNWALTGSSEFSHIRGANLLYYRGADIVARRDGVSLEAARRSIRETLGDTEALSEAERSELYAREGLALIRRYPWLFFQSQLQGGAKMMLVPGEGGVLAYLGLPAEEDGALGDLLRLSPAGYAHKWLGRHPVQFLVFVAAGLYLLSLYGLAAAGFGRCLVRDRRRRAGHLLVLAVIVYFLVLSAGPEAYARFRVPIMPFLALYAGRGIASLAGRTGANRRPRGVQDSMEEEGNDD